MSIDEQHERARFKGDDPDLIDLLIARWDIEKPDLNAEPLAILGRLHQAYMRYHKSAGRIMAEHGFNMATFDILVRLRTAGARYQMTVNELAKSGFVTPGGITQRVDRLVDSGHVIRVADENDSRKVHVVLTEQGKEAIDAIVVPHFANEELMLAGLSNDEQVQLALLLKKLLKTLSDLDSSSSV